jgi:hypothetical protein
MHNDYFSAQIFQHNVRRNVRAKKMQSAIKDSYDTVHDALVYCKLQGKSAIIPIIIVYLNNPFQDSTNA